MGVWVKNQTQKGNKIFLMERIAWLLILIANLIASEIYQEMCLCGGLCGQFQEGLIKGEDPPL